jgi:hypothetical protein
MLPGPGQDFRIEIDPDGGIFPATPDPFTTHAGRAAEILPHMVRPPVPQFAKRLVYKPVFLIDVLNRLFIENMPVGELRHGLFFALLFFFHIASATGMLSGPGLSHIDPGLRNRAPMAVIHGRHYNLHEKQAISCRQNIKTTPNPAGKQTDRYPVNNIMVEGAEFEGFPEYQIFRMACECTPQAATAGE